VGTVGGDLDDGSDDHDERSQEDHRPSSETLSVEEPERSRGQNKERRQSRGSA
jgi:hypothetical protein